MTLYANHNVDKNMAMWEGFSFPVYIWPYIRTNNLSLAWPRNQNFPWKLEMKVMN